MKIVIIGLGTAGFAAMLAVRKTNPDADIVIIDNKSFDLLHTCGIPYVLAGKIEMMDKLRYNLDFNSMKVNKVKGKAVSADYSSKKITLDDGDIVSYDRLIVASGSSAFRIPVEGADEAYIIDTIENAIKFENAIKKIKSIAIIGAGTIGIETAVALADKGIEVSVIEAMGKILPSMLDADMAEILQKKLEKKGIKFYLSRKVVKIGRRYVMLESGKSVKGDVVLMASGARPNIDFLKRILADKGLVVNERMETSIKDIYAAGDSVQVKNFINGKPSSAWLAGPAYKQGTIAGINAAGGNAKYKGAIGTSVVKINDIEAAATGLSSDVFGKITATDIASWHPDAKELSLKIFVDKETRRVIGGQAVGGKAADKINVIAAAVKNEMLIDDFADLELAYCPSAGDAYDILIAAADLALRKLDR